MDTKSTKITENKQKKMGIVAEISENFSKSNAVVFTNYAGLTHKQIETLKRQIKPFNAEYVVAKNTLVSRALDENKMSLSENLTLQGPTGTLFLYGDIVEPLKSLAKIIKELNLPNVKFGIMDKNFITAEQVLKLASLPNKETLLAQLVGGLKSPIFGLHRALNWNLQKLVLTLNAVANAKPATTAPTTTVKPIETPAEPTVAAKEEAAQTQVTSTSAETSVTESSEAKSEEVKIEKTEGGEN